MATLTLPYTFVDATTAEADEVNSNLTAIKDFIDTEVIQRDGTTALTALLTGPATDPTSDNHLARKKYVDDAIAAGSVAVAAAVTTAEEAADSQNYLMFANLLAAGNQVPKTNTALRFNSVTGQLNATLFAGSGASLTALDASQLSTGTVANARLPATISGKTKIGASTLDAEGGVIEFNSVATDTLDYGQTYTGLWTFTKAGDALGSITLGSQGITFPDLGLNNKMAFNWNGSGLEVYSNGTLVKTLTT